MSTTSNYMSSDEHKPCVAIYGGSFNPPTMSHYQIMQMIIEEIKINGESISEVWMIPCGDRTDKKISTPGEKRLVILLYNTLNRLQM